MFCIFIRSHHKVTHQQWFQRRWHYFDFSSFPTLLFNSFLVLKPFHPAWIFVAAFLQFCNSLRILKPFHWAWIFVADFSSSDTFSPPCPFCKPLLFLRLFLNCLRTRYPFHWAWILVAASSSDWEELGLDGWMALICIIGELFSKQRR